MCELFGFCGESAGRPDELLRSFAEHSTRNPHRWGVACYSHGQLAIRKMPETALSSKSYFEAIREAKGRSSSRTSGTHHAGKFTSGTAILSGAIRAGDSGRSHTTAT